MIFMATKADHLWPIPGDRIVVIPADRIQEGVKVEVLSQTEQK